MKGLSLALSLLLTAPALAAPTAGPLTAPPDQATPAACCKVCTKGKPCGNSCIARDRTCHQPPGCACRQPTPLDDLLADLSPRPPERR